MRAWNIPKLRTQPEHLTQEHSRAVWNVAGFQTAPETLKGAVHVRDGTWRCSTAGLDGGHGSRAGALFADWNMGMFHGGLDGGAGAGAHGVGVAATGQSGPPA